jgi:hypothetical protein
MGKNRGNAKSILRFLVIIVASFSLFSMSSPNSSYADESSCISCHTSMKKLIETIRVIEASKPKVEASTESEGEG